MSISSEFLTMLGVQDDFCIQLRRKILPFPCFSVPLSGHFLFFLYAFHAAIKLYRKCSDT
ncbi:MAG: hypothetical protein BECKG1743F_GA0114225_110141 [Candidatus Kentron sp. G]|nr:MAG: hypothetical protein BECKG1743F_GA0114225_110141 [Candidatus Kentron sp. G]